MFELWHYVDSAGRDRYQEWFDAIEDIQTRKRVLQRINRLSVGHFGDCKPCRDGVWELRLDPGPGYRVYYTRVGSRVVLLLGGGDKRTQDADIERAVQFLDDFRRRKP